MKAAPVERGVASAAYSFVRFSGGAAAPYLAGRLGEETNVHVPFWVGSFAVILAAAVLTYGRRYLTHIDEPEQGFGGETPSEDAYDEAELVRVGDA
jgi:hypothetical protein